MCQSINAKIKDYHEQLTQWAETNGISVIKTVPTFKLGTGELDDLCIDIKNDLHSTFNRLGAMKLLGVIKRQCLEFHLCNNWEQVKRTTNTHNVKQREKRNTEAFCPTPTSRTAAPSVNRPGLPPLITPTYQADSRTHNRFSSYALNNPTHRATHHPFTTSQRAPSYLRATPAPNPRSTTRERGWNVAGSPRSFNTYAAALRRVPEERDRTARYHSRHSHQFLKGMKHTLVINIMTVLIDTYTTIHLDTN